MTEISRYTAKDSYGYSYAYIIGYDLLGQDITNNYSTIRLYAQLEVRSSYISWSSGTASIYGNSFSLATRYNRGTVTVYQIDVPIYHEADGTKTIYIDGSINTTYVMKGNCGGYITLPTIARASSIGCPDFYIESSTNIVINSASNTFRHTLKYAFGNLSGTIVEKTALTNYSWTPNASNFYKQIPNAQYGVGTITCETYNGTTLIGTKSCNFTARVDKEKNRPIVGLTIVDINETTKALTGDENTLVKYFSNAKATITASAKNDATIKSYQINDGSSEQITTINNVEISEFMAKVIDSREIDNTSEKVTKDFINYVRLAIKSIDVERTGPTENQVILNLEGFYFNDTFGVENNQLDLKIRYKEQNGQWSNYYDFIPNISDNTFYLSNYNLNTLFNVQFNYQKNYVFEVYINDKLMNIEQEISLKRGLPVAAYGENFMHLYGDLEIDGKFNNLFPIGSIYLSVNSTNPSTYFGGKWELISQGRTLVGVDTTQTEFNTVKKIGGSKTETLSINQMPSHTHIQNAHGHGIFSGYGDTNQGYPSQDAYRYQWWGYYDLSWKYGGNLGTTYDTATNQYTGGSQAHNNLQPYYTCYIWCRVS